ncbi:hypothetical protein MNB_SM-7-1450 [hydrothermal vent metagenome]|uniref:Uncharacterized protein n=1 Tax=hydrothermal vent metagenome TaxID=652676 RepID=A0A1W1B8H6_9ZZZZ
MEREKGKILFYNDKKGEGIIISSTKKKYRFEVMEWNDFDLMPEKGLEVTFDESEENAKNIEIFKDAEIIKNEQNKEKEKEDNKNDINKTTKPSLKPHFKRDESLENVEIDPQLKREKPLSKKESKSANPLRYKDNELTQTEEEMLEKISNAKKSIEKIGENIKLTLSIDETMQSYFKKIQNSIEKRLGYKKVHGRLNYLLAKRFLWTTFNNLKEIDPHVVTLRIKSISEDLKSMSALYNDFEHKIKYPSVAYEEVFLTNQKEYEYLSKLNKRIHEKLNQLKSKEASLSSLKKAKQKELENISKKNTQLYQQKLKELKTVNGVYADIVHTIAKLQEEHTQNYEKLERFANNYRKDFIEKFKKESSEYESSIIEILDAQAYLLDSLLWKEAKTSKAILEYFDNLPIDMELNTKGYLKYYLDTLDEEKVNADTKELFTLYEHLQEVQKDCIVILMQSAQDAMECEQCLQHYCKDMRIKAFIDEVLAFKWAADNHVKVIILEVYLNSMDAKKFLDIYHNAILSKPKIILIGDQLHISSKKYSISKQLGTSVMANKVAEAVCEAVQKDE